jgi:uncharacterized membrane protein YtjA (UPF0391 family)
MLRWAVIFLLIGLGAGILGFTGIAGASFAIAKLLFFVFMVIFVRPHVRPAGVGRITRRWEMESEASCFDTVCNCTRSPSFSRPQPR